MIRLLKTLNCIFLLSTHWLHQHEKVSWTHLHPGRSTASAWCISISMAGSSLELNTSDDYIWVAFYRGHSEYIGSINSRRWGYIRWLIQTVTKMCSCPPCVWEQRWAQRRQRKAGPSSWSHSCMTPAFCVLGQSWWAPDTPDPPLQLWWWRWQEWSCRLSVCSGLDGDEWQRNEKEKKGIRSIIIWKS